MTPEARMAMPRTAVFEAGAYMVGKGTEGIVGTLTRRADLFEQARRYRNLAKTQLRTVTGADKAALDKVIADGNAFLTDLPARPRLAPPLRQQRNSERITRHWSFEAGVTGDR